VENEAICARHHAILLAGDSNRLPEWRSFAVGWVSALLRRIGITTATHGYYPCSRGWYLERTFITLREVGVHERPTVKGSP
jgi:hypothetical protein